MRAFITTALIATVGTATAVEAGGLAPPIDAGLQQGGQPLVGLARPQAAVAPTAYAQLSLELLNRARQDPAAEAARFGIDLNEGLASGTISATPKEPLAFNPYLIDAANIHCQWMLDNNVFQHSGSGGSSPGDRMEAAGYSFHGSYTWGENLAWQGTTGTPNVATYVIDEHESLFIDEGISGRGHRKSMLNGNFREVGIGVVPGVYTYNGTDYNAVMQGQDFAATGIGTDNVFITGVVYDDSVTDDDFYTVGEGWGNVTIEILNPTTSAVVASTTSWSSGGYRVAVPDGAYTLRASGGGMSGAVTVTGLTVAGSNIKVDIDPTTATATRRISLQIISGYDWYISPDAPSSTSNATHQTFSELDPSADHTCTITANAGG